MGAVSVLIVILVGLATGATTVLFGFGGGFVTVPVMLWIHAAAGPGAAVTAVATSAIVMVVNAAVATLATPRAVLAELRGTAPLLSLLAAGGLAGALLATTAPEPLITWGFVAYLAVTIVDALCRPGFLRPTARPTALPTARVGHTTTGFAIRSGLGLPIGALAAFLGVGGSVLTVPLLRRAGQPMRVAAALANPLTLCVAVPALAVFLLTAQASKGVGNWALGAVDFGAAALLLVGSVPVVVLWRRRPPRLPDALHAWGYVGLLGVVLGAVLAQLW